MKTIEGQDKIIEQFERDWETMSEYWADLHAAHKKDMKFTWFNDQWDRDTIDARKNPITIDGQATPARPCHVFNIVKPFIIKVCNGIKKLRMTIKVTPVDGGTDKELAEVRRGIHRAIERNTGASSARDNAVVQAVSAGYGFYAFMTDFEDPKSFNHEIKYRVIDDASCVLWDDDDKTKDGSGLKKLIFQEPYGKDEFKREFGIDPEDVGFGGHELSGAWGSKDKPIVSEYWYIGEKKETLVMVNGVEMFLSEVKEKTKNEGVPAEVYLDIDESTGEPYNRETHSREVYCCKMAGRRVLSKDLWKGYWIPWFKIDGRKNVCDGDVIMSGLGRDAKPSQESYNYARNNMIERLGLSTKVPFMVPVEGIPKSEAIKWNTSNSRNWDHLKFNAYDEQGRPIPQPIRTPAAPVDSGMLNEAGMSRDEVMAVMGLYGSYTGDTQSEKSGKAILAGAQESADIVFDFADNKVHTMRHEGKVREELIPKIWDTARQVRMVGEDEQEKVVMVNQQAQDENGKPYYYDLRQGKFDIAIEMGPSDESKRMESREGMELYMKALPQFAPAIMDLYAKEQDWRYADEIAERATNWIKTNMPGIIKEKDGPPPEVQQMQQQMEQMKQEAMQAIQQLQQENEQLKQKTAIEMQKIQMQSQLEGAKLKEQKSKNEEDNEVAVYNAETARMKAEADARDKSKKINIDSIKTINDMRKGDANGIHE